MQMKKLSQLIKIWFPTEFLHWKDVPVQGMQKVTGLALAPKGQQKIFFFLKLNEPSWHHREIGKYSKGP